MSTTIIRHRVADFDVWRNAYDAHGTTRREYGIADFGVYRDEDDPNVVTIILRADDSARVREFMSSDGLKRAMSDAGVISQPEAWITTEV